MNNYRNKLYEEYKASTISYGPVPSLNIVIQSNIAMLEDVKRLYVGNTKFKKKYVRLEQ